MTESSPDESSSRRKDFICGVVEGFYGRPWTTEQRKDLFHKLKKWGMDMYVYAPKDDYKHRAYWRELYTVEEAEHLTSLICAAKSQGITFCYALSPGLDITYSSQKEITTLKRKLEQVSQFGCTCFALLFDDIEPEMSEADKQIFQSFAHAQVSVTNEIHQHLGCPRFLLCPTQYCSTRAVPTVNSSEYLITLGTKLSQQIDIMWTGPKVISKTLTTECIEEITQVLRRPPVIWDNLHANDYDQKRIFLGPYCGRSPELIPLLRGVLSNPNCEYNANMIPIWTLAHWASCSLDAPAHMEAVSWDIKLERESEQGVCEDEPPLTLGKHVYHHRQALRQAINEWLPEFSIPKTAQGPVIKPQPPVTVPPVPIIPILPSVNTCMSLMTATSTTHTTSTADMSAPVPSIPTINTSQLQALADVCSATPDRPILSTGVSGQLLYTLLQIYRILAHWASCSLDAPAHMEAVSWDIKLERESEQGVCEDEPPLTLGKHVYHHRQALRQAINEWLPEFSIPKTAQGPVIKPQPSVTVPPVPIIPILPSVNTCMSLMTATSTTHTTSTADMSAPVPSIPTINTSQLQALADVCSATPDRPILSTGVSPIETFNPVANPVMNSLVSPTKVILNESIPNPIIPIASSNMALPSEIPVSTLPVPILGLKALEGHNAKDQNMDKIEVNDTASNDSVLETSSFIEEMKKDKEDDTIIVDDVESQVEMHKNGEMSIGDTPQTLSPTRLINPEPALEPLDVDPPSTAADSDVVMNDGLSENGSMQVEPSNSPLSGDMMVEPTELTEPTDDGLDEPAIEASALTTDDLMLLCDLFYLPFEHGARGLRLLHDFNWLLTHAASVLPRGNKSETGEWRRRLRRFSWWAGRARRLGRRLGAAANRELHAELQPYVWELCAVLALLTAFLRWLELGKFPQNITSNTQASPKVISKTLTTECIEEITQVLRRPPVIWDNLHANDYDQKRIFLGKI
ncbi:Bifunctional protein NCOAT [Papilio machaon]|uniref:protein O-GlcNAcase n=1 Tax=Papilio machaon TaxID=76193 RepID=A0A0N1IET9_PAPMA|nr:Bifunctional protein NCOAT [Papilio machaon]